MTAVLLIHGFPSIICCGDINSPPCRAGADIAPDLPGAGTSPGFDSPDAYSMSSYATFLVGILDQLKVRQAVICGLSMGGYIAFELVRRFPERVRAAILCNTKAAADSPEAKRGRDALAAKAQDEGARAVAAELVPKVIARATRERQPDVVKEVTEMIARQPVPGIVGALRALRERPDSTPLLAAIRVPVLVVAGDDDQIAPGGGNAGAGAHHPRRTGSPWFQMPATSRRSSSPSS